MKPVRVILLPLVFASVLAAQTSPAPKPPIIDMHMHARTQTARGPDGQPVPRPCMLEPCEPRRGYSTDEGILRESIALMERHNIVNGFLSGRLEDVYKWVEAAPDRLIPSITLGGTTDGFPDLEKLREEYRRGWLKGMGEIATQYATISPNDPRLEPYYSLAEEFDVPVLIHTLGLGARDPGFRSSLGRPLLLEEVLVRHPKLRIYLENAGYPYLDEIIALMTQYPQVYADLSTTTWIIPRTAFHRYLKSLMDAGLGERLMFGSDQMEWPEAIGLAIEAIESADFLTVEQKRDIFYNNAARFLQLQATE